MNMPQELRRKLPELPKKLALAARYALDNPDRIALDSMRTSATAVGVTSTTMLRLARQMGFESYEDFRAGFQAELLESSFGARAGALHTGTKRNGQATLADKIHEATEQNIRSALARLDPSELSKMAQIMREAHACYLVGSGSLFWLAALMKTTGTMVLPNLRLVGAEYAVAAEAIGQLSPDDVVICLGINPCAIRTIDALHYAREQGAHTIAMTDRPSSPLAENAEFVFCADTKSPHYYPSVVAMMQLIETLLATVVAEGGHEELERIEQFEAQRKATASYVEY